MTVHPGEWARIKEVFDAARTLPAADRRPFVVSACAGDIALQERVEKLLAAHQLASSFLEVPAALSNDSMSERAQLSRRLGAAQVRLDHSIVISPT